MMSHPSSEELFAYRDGELDNEKRGLIEAHVLSCTACAARLEAVSDAEGALRQAHTQASEGYFESMTESVLSRVAGGAPARVRDESRAAAPVGPAGPKAVAPAGGFWGSAAPQPIRRRNFGEDERGRAPRLPWPAIISAVSAAAAVLVVGVILYQQSAFRGAPRPGVLGLGNKGASPEEKAAARPEADDRVAASGESTAESFEDKKVGAPQSAQPPVAGALGRVDASKPDALTKREAAANEDRPSVKQEEQVITSENAGEVQPEARQKAAEGGDERFKASASRIETKSYVGGISAAPSAPGTASDFGTLVANHGLPTVYDPSRVSRETLLQVEPELRTLYQTGGAGADSARVRLYLAEAARARAGESPDAETYDTIVHHYQRVLQLARDPETWRMARKRLEDFMSRVAPATER